ncbi:class I SAM-dependent methyltransferase [Marinobacter litoralis]|uniref:class I SAM-dependent methyltransferase n=1 Tax=Marinobacter litoralis TaxID=187981 RepID=UPI0018EC9B02|nr:methyltransferase [Marinobacter litoralis]MBJ6137458.1 methyltransferase [Marinobacter litoralis]
MTSEVLEIAGQRLAMKRPGSEVSNLRAWDAADELLLDEALNRLTPKHRVLVIDDAFGALTLGLADYSPVSVSDSAALSQALKDNALRNPNLPSPSVPASWLNPPEGPFDLVVLRIPRQAEYLAWLLRWVNSQLAEDGCLLAGGMIKHLPERSVDVFAGAVKTETVLPARKKARVVVCRRGSETLEGWPSVWKGYQQHGVPAPVEAMPAVFSRERLDIGTRELLPLVGPAVQVLKPEARILDLACGNGVLGLSALACRPDVAVDFSDVSSQAVASAHHNLRHCAFSERAQLHHSDGVPTGCGEFQLILLNPPFHEGGVVGDHIALRLFKQAAKHLAADGRVLMVGNRHLGYHRSLKRYFRSVEQRAASPRFVVFEAAL